MEHYSEAVLKLLPQASSLMAAMVVPARMAALEEEEAAAS